jgi:photosystem II stability/assembly factor-like uncharacterized protein
MKKKIISNITLSLILTTLTLAQVGWIQQSSGIPCALGSVYFVNENKGWAVSGACPSGGLIMKTTDAGLHWIWNTNTNLFSITFINNNTGWTVGGDFNGGIIMKTANGGTNWSTVFEIEGYGFNSVSFVDENIGYVAGGQWTPYRWGTVFKTTNGGNDWFITIPYPYSTEAFLNSVFFINQNLGWAVGENGVIRKTTNGGNDWNLQSLSGDYFTTVFFIDESTGWVVGHQSPNGIILKTTNGGTNWIDISPNIVSDKYVGGVYFLDAFTGWVVGNDGLVIKTIDGGDSWDIQNSGTYVNLYAVHFIDSCKGWAVGSNGTILHTTNGGVTFIEEINEAPPKFSIEQNYPNPFNPTTKIKFGIPSVESHPDASLPVTLKVYDVLGNEVVTLVNEEKQPGTYEIQFDGMNLPSGIYFYQLRAGTFVESKKMILIK